MSISSKELLLAKTKERLNNKSLVGNESNDERLSTTALNILQKAKLRRTKRQIETTDIEGQEEEEKPRLPENHVEKIETEISQPLLLNVPESTELTQMEIPKPSEPLVKENARLSAQRLLELAREKTSKRRQLPQDLDISTFAEMLPIPEGHSATIVSTHCELPESNKKEQKCRQLISNISELDIVTSPPTNTNPDDLLQQLCPDPPLHPLSTEKVLIQRFLSKKQCPIYDPDESDIQSILLDLAKWKTRDLKQQEHTHSKILMMCDDEELIPYLLHAGGLTQVIDNLRYYASQHSAEHHDILQCALQIILKMILFSIKKSNTLVSILPERLLVESITFLLNYDCSIIVDGCLAIITVLGSLPHFCDSLSDSGICSMLIKIYSSAPLSEDRIFLLAELILHPKCRSSLVHLDILNLLLKNSDVGPVVSGYSSFIIGVIASDREYEMLFDAIDPSLQIIDVLQRYSRAEVVVEYSLFALQRLCCLHYNRGKIYSNVILQNQVLSILHAKSSRSNIVVYSLALLVGCCQVNLSARSIKLLLSDLINDSLSPSQIALCCLLLSNLTETDIEFENALLVRNICQTLVHLYKHAQAFDGTLLSSLELGVSAMCRIDPNCRRYFFELRFTQIIVSKLVTVAVGEPLFLTLLNFVVNLCLQFTPYYVEPSNMNQVVEGKLHLTLLSYLSEDKVNILEPPLIEQVISSICHIIAGSVPNLEADSFNKSDCVPLCEILKRYPNNEVIISSTNFLLSSLVDHIPSTAAIFLDYQIEKTIIDILVKNFLSPRCCETALRLIWSLSKYSLICSSDPELSNVILKLFTIHFNERNIIILGLSLFPSILSSASLKLDIPLLCERCELFLNKYSSDKLCVCSICDILSQISPAVVSSKLKKMLIDLLQEWHADQILCEKIIFLFTTFLKDGNGLRDCQNFSVLLRILQDPQHEFSTKSVVCELLAVLCEDVEGAAMKCGDLDACAIVVDLLAVAYQFRELELMKTSSKLMASLISFHVHNQIVCGTLALNTLVLYLFGAWESEIESEIKENLLRALNGLCLCENSSTLDINRRNLTILQESNVVKGIVNCLRKFPTCEGIVFRGFQLLFHLCTNDHCKKKTLDEGIVPLFLAIFDVHQYRQQVILFVCRNLAQLTENSRCASLFDKESLCQRILNLMSHCKEVEIFIPCCETLSHLLLHSDGKDLLNIKQEYLFEHFIINHLSNILQEHPQDVHAYFSVVELLQQLVHHNPPRSILVTNSDLVVLVVKGIEIHYCNIAAIRSCCTLISKLAVFGMSNQLKLGQLGVCDRILSVLAVYSDDLELVSSACLAIDTLCSGCDENSLRFGEKGACELITTILESHKQCQLIMKAASGAVSSLSLTNSKRLGTEDICSKLLESIKESFVQRDDILFTSSLGAFKSVCERNLTNQLECGDIGACEFFLEVLLNWQHNSHIVDVVLEAVEGLCRYNSESLTFLPPNVNRFAMSGAPTIIFHLIITYNTNSDIVRRGSYILYYLLSCCPNECAALDKSKLSELFMNEFMLHLRNPLVVEALFVLLELLFCMSIEMVNYLCNYNFVTLIADSFRIHTSLGSRVHDSSLAQKICSCILTFLQCGGHQVAIHLESTDIPLLLCSTLKEFSENPKLCSVVCVTLSQMLSVCQPSLGVVMRLGGICEILVKVLKLYSVNNVEVAVTACKTLVYLFGQSQESLTLCSTAGICGILCDSLAQSSSCSNYCVIATQLLSLLSLEPTSRSVLQSVPDIFDILLALINSYLSNVDVIRYVGLTISSLLSDESTMVVLGSDAWNLFQHLCSTFETCDNEVIFCYLFALQRIISTDLIQANFVHDNLFEVLVSFVYRTCNDAKIVSLVFLFISSLTSNNLSNTRQFINSGICESIAAVLKFSSNHDILTAVCACVDSLSCCEDCVHQFVELGVYSKIFSLEYDNWNKKLVLSWSNCLQKNCRYECVYRTIDVPKLLAILQTIVMTTSPEQNVLKSLCHTLLVLSPPDNPRPELENLEFFKIILHYFEIYSGYPELLEPLLQLIGSICSHNLLLEFSDKFQHNLNEIFQQYRYSVLVMAPSLKIFTFLCRRTLLSGTISFAASIFSVLKDYVENQVILNLCLESVNLLCQSDQNNIPIFLHYDLPILLTSFIARDHNNEQTTLLVLRNVCILCDSRISDSSRICESDLPTRVFDLYKDYCSQVTFSESSVEIIKAACDTVATLLQYSTIFDLFANNGIVEIALEAFRIHLNSRALTSICFVLVELLRCDGLLVSSYHKLGLFDNLMLALQLSEDVECCMQVVSLTTTLLSFDRELVVPYLLINGTITEDFTRLLKTYYSSGSVFIVVCRCISLVVETGLYFAESTELYSVLFEGLILFRNTSDTVDLMICSTLLMISRYSPHLAEKFGTLGLCEVIAEKILSFILLGETKPALQVLQLLETLCDLCIANRSRALTKDVLEKILQIFESSELHQEDSIVNICLFLNILQCDANIKVFSETQLSSKCLSLLQMFKKNRRVVIALCDTLKIFSQEGTGYDNAQLTLLSSELSEIYQHDGQALARCLSLLTHIHHNLDSQTFDILAHNLRDVISDLQNSLENVQSTHQYLESLYALVKEFPCLVTSPLEIEISCVLCNAMSLYCKVPAIVDVSCLIIAAQYKQSEIAKEHLRETDIVFLLIFSLSEFVSNNQTFFNILEGVKVLLSDEILKQSFRRSELSEILIKRLHSESLSTELIFSILETLRQLCTENLSRYSKALIVSYIQAGLCPILFKILQLQLRSKKFCNCCVLLLRCLFGEIEGRLQLVSQPICKVLLEALLIQKEDLTVCSSIFTLLNDLTSYGDITDISLLYSKDWILHFLEIVQIHLKDRDFVLAVGDIFGAILSNMSSCDDISLRMMNIVLGLIRNYSSTNSKIVAQGFSHLNGLISPVTVCQLDESTIRLLISTAKFFQENSSIAEKFLSLANRFSEYNISRLKYWIEGGFCELCVNLMNLHFRSPTVGSEACRAVSILGQNQSHVITLFGNHEGPKVIASILQWNLSTNKSVTQTAIKAILTLSMGNLKNVSAFGLYGVCEMVIKFATDVQNDFLLTELAIHTILELSKDTMNQRRFVNCQVPQLLLHAADSYSWDANIARAVSGCIWHLTSNDTESQQVFISLAAPQRLEKILKTHPKHEDISRYCCSALWSLSSHTTNDSSSSCRILIDTLQEHIENPEVVSTVLSTVGRMCQSSRIALLFGAVGACELVWKVFTNYHNPATIASACHALSGLCCDERNREKFFEYGIVRKLCDYIQRLILDVDVIMSVYLASSVLIKERSDIAQEYLECNFNALVMLSLHTYPTHSELLTLVFKTVSELIEMIPSAAEDFGATGTCEIVANILNDQTLRDGLSTVEALYLMHVLCMNFHNIPKIFNPESWPSVVEASQKFVSLGGVIVSFSKVIQSVTSEDVAERKFHQQLLACNGACQVLIEAIHLHLSNAEVLHEVILALIAISFQNMSSCECLFETNSLDNIYSALDYYSVSNLKISVSVCRLILILSTSMVNEYLGRLGICDHVVNALHHATRQEDAESCETIAYTIVRLVSENTGNQVAFGRNSKTSELLVTLLSGWARVSLRAEESALWAICILCQHSSNADSICVENIKRFRSGGIFSVVIATISKHAAIQNCALIGCRTLGSLTMSANIDDLNYLGSLGAIDTILNVLMQHKSSFEIVDDALKTLSNLCHSSSNVRLLSNLPLEKVLFMLLESYSVSNRSITGRLCEVVSSLASDNDMRSVISRLHICEYLVKSFILFHYSDEFTRVFFPCVVHLVSITDDCFASISQSNLPECILEDYLPLLLNSNTVCEENILNSLRILTLLAENNTENCHRLVRLGACKIIVRILQQSTSPILIDLLADLSRILALNCENTLNILSELGSLDFLLATFQKYENFETPDSSVNQALQVLMTDPNTRSDLGLKSTVNIVLRPLKAGCDLQMMEQSCLAITRYIQNCHDIIPFLLEQGICEALATCIRRSHKSSNLISASLTLIETLCEGQSDVAAIMRTSGVCEVIANVVRRLTSPSITPPNNVNEAVLSSIYQLSFDSENSAFFNLSGCCEHITLILSSAISSRNERIVGLATRAMYKLCETHSANMESFGIAGACVLISTALSGLFTFEFTLESSMLALCYLSRNDNHISTENVQNATAFYNMQIDEKVITILQKSLISPKLCSSGSLAIQRLAKDYISINRLCDLGACELIPAILSRYLSKSKEVTFRALSALDSLTQVDRNINHLMRDGTVSTVSQLLNQYGGVELHVAISCSNIVVHLADVHHHLLEEFIHEGFCEGILKSCISFGDNVPSYYVISICSAISRLLSSSEALKRFEITQFGDVLIKYLVKFGSDEKSVSVVHSILARLSSTELVSSYLIVNGLHLHLLSGLRRHMKCIVIVASITSTLTRLLNPNKHRLTFIQVLIDSGLIEILLGIARKYPENSEITLKVCMILSVIGVNDNVSLTLGQDGACEIILNALRTFPGDAGVILYGCKAVRTLSIKSDNQVTFLDAGIIAILLSILKRFVHTESVISSACSALVGVCDQKTPLDQNYQNKLLDSAGDLLKLVIIQIESAQIVEQLCLLFHSLARNTIGQQVLGSHDICRCVSLILQKHLQNDQVAKEVIFLVSRLAYKCGEIRSLFTKTNIFEYLMRAFKLHSNNDKVVEGCCLAVTSLTYSNDLNAVSLGKYGVCEMITAVLIEKGTNSLLVGVACQTIHPLVQIESNHNEFLRLKFPQLITQILKQHYNMPIITHICSAISSFFRRTDWVGGITDFELCGLLVKAINSQMSNSDPVAAVAAAITVLACASERCSLEFQQSGVTDSLMTALSSYRENSSTYLRVISSMLAISKHCQSTGQTFGSSLSVFDILVYGLRNYIDDVQIIDKIGQLIVYLVTSDSSRTSAGISGICEALARVFEYYAQNGNIIAVLSISVSCICDNHPINSDRCAKSKLCLMVLRGLEQFLSNIEVTKSLLLAVKSLSNTVLNRRFFSGGDGCELLKIVLLKNIDFPEVVMNCCRAIENICEDNIENKDVFGRVGLIEIVVKLLSVYIDQEGLIIAIYDLILNMIVEHQENTKRLIQNKIAEVFVSNLLHHQKSSEIYLRICRIFITLLQTDPEFICILQDLNLRFVVVSALPIHQFHTAASLYLMRLLRDMYTCMENDNGIDAISNECEHVTEFLKSNVNNLAINEDACSVIFLLCRSRASNSATLFGSFGACELITKVASQALENKSISLAKMALLAVVSLCAGNIDNQQLFGDCNACAIVVSILDTLGGSFESIEMEGASLNAIAMLARSSKLKSSENVSNIGQLCHNSACESVTRCLESRLDNMPVVYSACRAIFCLAGEEECCQRLIRSNVSDILVRILKSYQTFPAISQYACGAIASLGEYQFAFDSLAFAGACDPLIKAIVTNKEDIQLAIHGCNAITKLSRNMELRTTLGTVGGCKAVVSVFKLHFSNLAFLGSALLAIASLSHDVPLHVEFFIQANLPNRIITIIGDNLKDEFICSCILRVLSTLSIHSFAKDIIRNTGILDFIPSILAAHPSTLEVVLGSCKTLIHLLKVDEMISIPYFCAELCNYLSSAIVTFENEPSILRFIFECLLTLSNASEDCKTRFSSILDRQSFPSLNPTVQNPYDAMLLCNRIRFYSLNLKLRTSIGEQGFKVLSHIFSTFTNQEEVILLAVLAMRSLVEGCEENQIKFGVPRIFSQLTSLMSLYLSSYNLCYSLSLVILSLGTIQLDNLLGLEPIEFCGSLSSYMQTCYDRSEDFDCICRLIILLGHSPDCKTRLGKYRMCDFLVLSAGVYQQNTSLLTICLRACISLALDNKENIVSLGSNEMCKTLLSISHTHINLLDVMKPCVQLCCLISNNHSVRVRLGEIGICEVIVTICRNHHADHEVLTASLSSMRTLASNVPNNKKLLGDNGCCELLVEILKFGYCDSNQIEIACGAIANLCNESQDGQNVLKFDSAGIITAFVVIFQNHVASSSIIKQVCAAIRHMTSSPSAPQKKFGELEVCEKVVNSLAIHLEEPGVNLVICSSLRGLAQDPDNKILLGASGACSIVTKVLRFSVDAGDIKLTEEALLSIASLVQGSCSNQDTAGKAGACEAISELIGADNGVGIDEKALWCVTYLCRSGFDSNTTNDKNILLFTSNGVLESIFHDFELYPNHQNLIIAASWALRNMCFIQSNAFQVITSRRFEILLKVLVAHITNSSICEAICFALSSILINDAKVPLGQTGICELLPQLIQRHLNTPSIIDRCCSCIANLASQSAEYRHRLSVANVCSLIVRILKVHKEHSAVIEEACGVVWNMCIDSPENRLKFGIEGTCELIVEVMLLHGSDLYVKEAAIGAIKSLTTANAENIRRMEACGIKIEGDGLILYTSKLNTRNQLQTSVSHDSLRE